MLMRILRQAGLSARVALALVFSSPRRFPWSAALYLLGGSLVAFTSLNVDRWMGAALLDKAHFAVYAFAAVVLAMAQLAQSVISAGAFPLLARRVTQFGEAHAIRLAAAWSLGALACGLLAAVPGALFIEPAIARFFPNYGTAVAPILILIPAALLRVSDFWSSFLIVAERELLLLFGQVVALCATFSLWLLLFGNGLLASETAFAWLALACAASAYAVSATTALWVYTR
jgi:O-antigen/teichoic acid export membrane protein